VQGTKLPSGAAQSPKRSNMLKATPVTVHIENGHFILLGAYQHLLSLTNDDSLAAIMPLMTPTYYDTTWHSLFQRFLYPHIPAEEQTSHAEEQFRKMINGLVAKAILAQTLTDQPGFADAVQKLSDTLETAAAKFTQDVSIFAGMLPIALTAATTVLLSKTAIADALENTFNTQTQRAFTGAEKLFHESTTPTDMSLNAALAMQIDCNSFTNPEEAHSFDKRKKVILIKLITALKKTYDNQNQTAELNALSRMLDYVTNEVDLNNDTYQAFHRAIDIKTTAPLFKPLLEILAEYLMAHIRCTLKLKKAFKKTKPDIHYQLTLLFQNSDTRTLKAQLDRLKHAYKKYYPAHPLATQMMACRLLDKMPAEDVRLIQQQLSESKTASSSPLLQCISRVLDEKEMGWRKEVIVINAKPIDIVTRHSIHSPARLTARPSGADRDTATKGQSVDPIVFVTGQLVR
jgi:hypothetical protein